MPRSRSRSPRRDDHKSRISRGLKWKDSSRADTETSSRHDRKDDKNDEHRRERAKRRAKKSHVRDGGERRQSIDASERHERRREKYRKLSPNEDDSGNVKEPEIPALPIMKTAPDVDDLKVASKFGAAAAAKVKPINLSQDAAPVDAVQASSSRAGGPTSSSSKSKVPTGPMMLVTVNDRLGTKKEVPCLGSDTVGDFKKLVAMQIGRRPQEIMLKRQSERPLKDSITLDDYEISSGVQLDLELNTGD